MKTDYEKYVDENKEWFDKFYSIFNKDNKIAKEACGNAIEMMSAVGGMR